MTVLHATHQAVVFVVLVPLVVGLLPCQVVRTRGVTVLYVDPTTSRMQAVRWSIDNLTVAERQYLRAVLRQPPIGRPMQDCMLDGTCDHVPSMLRPPGDRARVG